jgi:hypothetical protein
VSALLIRVGQVISRSSGARVDTVNAEGPWLGPPAPASAQRPNADRPIA